MANTLNINDKLIEAETGETLVDAALASKILIPHDCASGQCETCRVRVPWGLVDDDGTSYGDTVLACRARVAGDATITFEEVPTVSSLSGIVESITALSNDVVEVCVRTATSYVCKPGQYAKVTFYGFPPREYSYSAPMTRDREPTLAVFQIKRFDTGRVSSSIGKSIGVGHSAKIAGPFGNAFLREQETGPLILASTGTGFAPIWSLACALAAADAKRQVAVLTGARTLDDFYMAPAIERLRDFGHDVTLSVRNNASGELLLGTPDQHLPSLTSETTIHAAGHPQMVKNTKNHALNAGAQCYADPFTPSLGKRTWRDRIGWISDALNDPHGSANP